MSLKFVLPLALASAYLPFTDHLHAATYTETGDAGDMLPTAQVVMATAANPAGTSLTAISGSITATNNVSDGDLFEIYINSPSTFSASLTAFIPGSNNFDSQLFLFNASGVGVVSDDDDPNSGSAQSNLPAGSITGQTAGVYYLLIDGSGRYAASAGGLIFPNYTDGTTDPTVVQGPTGPGGVGALSGYSGNSSEHGNYTIALAGAQFVPAAVPEPGTWALVAAGAAGLACFVRARRAA